MIWNLKRDTLIQRDQIVIKLKHLTPLSTYWIILMRYRNWEMITNCLGRLQGEHLMTMNRYDELRDAIWDFILARRNTFSSFVENEDVEAYIQSMRKDGEYRGEIEIIAFSMVLQISVWIYGQESSLDTHLQYENANSTHKINLRYYEDDLHYNSLRVKEGCEAIDFDEGWKKWVQKMLKNQSLHVRIKRTELFEEKKRRVYWSTSWIDLWIS